MVTLKFALQCKIRDIQTVELPDYKAFFDFYLSNYDKGIIFDVKEIKP